MPRPRTQSACGLPATEPWTRPAKARQGSRSVSGARRRQGASGYAIERAFEDVATVVAAVAARTGGPVALFGHSYGANCAMGTAALTSNVDHLALMSPVWA